LAAPAARQTGPNPNDVYIQAFTYAGSGCPVGSVANAIDATKTVLILLYDSYVAQIGPGTLTTDYRKNCQINLELQYPSGWQFSLSSVDYRGLVDLGSGVDGTVATYEPPVGRTPLHFSNLIDSYIDFCKHNLRWSKGRKLRDHRKFQCGILVFLRIQLLTQH
jgi:Domain of unknown function (DUF4360)